MSIGHYEGYILKIGSLVFLQEYEVDRSSSGVQENLRNRLAFDRDKSNGLCLLMSICFELLGFPSGWAITPIQKS